MNLPLYIAKRYLFSKKKQNIINIVTLISVVGIALSTAAMVIVLSAFNGIEGIVENLYNSFDADIKITLNSGKTFRDSIVQKVENKQLPHVKYICPVIEETAIFKNGDVFATAKLKGVSTNFTKMIALDSLLFDGYADVQHEGVEYCIPGVVLQSRLGVSANPKYDNLISVHGMLRTKKISLTSTPYNKKPIQVGGVFMTGTPNDEKYVLCSIDFAKSLLEYKNEITAIEIGLDDDRYLGQVKNNLKELLGENFSVKTKTEQNQLIFSATKNEKIATYIILAFVLVISAFTLIASLTMLVLEKRKDIFTLFALGFNKAKIEKLFFAEGLLINFIGGTIGLFLGGLVCALQIWFGLIPMDGMIVDSYPVEVEVMDLVLIISTVIVIGFISSYFPVKYLINKLELS